MKLKRISIFFLLSLLIPAFLLANTIIKKGKGVELINKRTLTSKKYLNPVDNTVTVEISSRPVHYQKHPAGDWHDINTNIIQSPDEQYYEVSQGLYKTRFARDLTETEWPVIFELHDSTYFRSKLIELAY